LSGFDADALPSEDSITSVKVYVKVNFWSRERYQFLRAMRYSETIDNLYSYTSGSITTHEFVLDAHVDEVMQALNESSFGIRIIMSPTARDSLVDVYSVKLVIEYDVPVNKVVYDGKTLIDLTTDTVTPETLLSGYTAHDRSGAIITGTASTGVDGDEIAYGGSFTGTAIVGTARAS